MKKIMYIYNESDPLKNFCMTQLKIAKIPKNVVYYGRPKSEFPEITLEHQAKGAHTLIVFDKDWLVLDRINGPFSAADIEGALASSEVSI